MKKFDLIHTTILIVAILSAYAALQSFITFLSVLAYGIRLSYPDRQPADQIVFYLIPVVAFSAACILLIKNGRRYTTTLLKNDPEDSREEAAHWQLDRTNLIFVLFIGMGLYTLIHSIPYVISHFFELFRSKTVGAPAKDSAKTGLLIQLLVTTIGAFLIYAAPNLTDFIEKNIAARLGSNTQPDKDV